MNRRDFLKSAFAGGALIATAKFSDTGGFAFGMAFGKHKMCPAISPKKSWEGLAGSMVFATATAAVFLALARKFGWGDHCLLWKYFTWPLVVPAGICFALAATAGDLIENVVASEQRGHPVEDKDIETIFVNMRKLHHLDQMQVTGLQKQDFGALPPAAVVLFAGLGIAWAGIAVYYFVRKKKEKDTKKCQSRLFRLTS